LIQQLRIGTSCYRQTFLQTRNAAQLEVELSAGNDSLDINGVTVAQLAYLPTYTAWD